MKKVKLNQSSSSSPLFQLFETTILACLFYNKVIDSNFTSVLLFGNTLFENNENAFFIDATTQQVIIETLDQGVRYVQN